MDTDGQQLSTVPARVRRRCRGFSRVDLLAGLFMLLLLAGWFAFQHWGEHGRLVRCARNLNRLGQALHSFAGDHSGALPPAGIEPTQATWDMRLYSYLDSSVGKANAAPSDNALRKSVSARFLCPSDPIQRGERPRSYAMSAHDMKPEHWPPGPENRTGVGLWWDSGTIAKTLGAQAPQTIGQNTDALAMLKFSHITDPANTLLLTELSDRDNRMRSLPKARIASEREQLAAADGNPVRLHKDRFNYLMADGHVELVAPAFFPPDNTGVPRGIWTIKAGD